MNFLSGKAWLPIEGAEENFYDELGVKAKVFKHFGPYIYTERKELFGIDTFWQRLVLEKPFIVEFSSISEAARLLKEIQRNWVHFPVANFRRAELIKEKLPFIQEKERAFPFRVPLSPMGIWSLLDEKTLFGSAVTSSPFPLGSPRFIEDHENPPSRAYLKLYEALTWVQYLVDVYDLQTKLPQKGSRCVDAGACPGGWTWVLDLLGADIIAIDRSELDVRLMNKQNIRFIKHDAFTLKPSDLGPQDWVCSDVICYPERLLEWVRQWLDSGLCENFICTIKMQGKADHETTRAFAQIAGSKVIHLGANKNELTWIRLGKLESAHKHKNPV